MIDERFSIPMINCHAGHIIFINDFVDCKVEGILTMAKVKKGSIFLWQTHWYNIACFCIVKVQYHFFESNPPSQGTKRMF